MKERRWINKEMTMRDLIFFSLSSWEVKKIREKEREQCGRRNNDVERDTRKRVRLTIDGELSNKKRQFPHHSLVTRY